MLQFVPASLFCRKQRFYIEVLTQLLQEEFRYLSDVFQNRASGRDTKWCSGDGLRLARGLFARHFFPFWASDHVSMERRPRFWIETRPYSLRCGDPKNLKPSVKRIAWNHSTGCSSITKPPTPPSAYSDPVASSALQPELHVQRKDILCCSVHVRRIWGLPRSRPSSDSFGFWRSWEDAVGEAPGVPQRQKLHASRVAPL